MIKVCIEVPAHYYPKAEFTLRNLLSILRQKMVIIPKSDFNNSDGGIYYGTANDEGVKRDNVYIHTSSDAISYFQERRPYDKKKARFIEGIYTHSIPVLFQGKADTGHKDKSAVDEDDIIASAFFFLSDWQNGISERRDQHGRCIYEDSLQYSLGITDYPVVNEYALLLAARLKEVHTATFTMDWNGAGFALALTHDIDRLKKKTKGTWARETVDFLLLNKNRQTLPERLDRWQSSVLDLLTPGDTYQDSIMKLTTFSEERGIRPTFFLQSGIVKHPNDSANYLDLPFLGKFTERIARIGGEIGYHPGYEAGYQSELFDRELHQLETRVGDKVKSVRFHYLRFDPEQMAGTLSDRSMEQDSSLAWAEQAGPRTGSVSPHTLFDRNNNRDSSVLEIPMIAMDAQLMNYMKLNISEAVGLLRKQVDLVQRYNGVIVWNYHHLVYDPIEAPGWSRLFGESLNYALEKEPHNETFKNIARNWFAF